MTTIRWLRTPFDYPFFDIKKTLFLALLHYTKRFTNGWYHHADYFVGLARSSRIDVDFFRYVLAHLKPGITEINLHPGTDNHAIGQRYGYWKASHNWSGDWEREYGVLLDPQLKELIRRERIRLICYADLSARRPCV